MRSFKQSGFTMIELMVTVAVIGITAAVAIPSYQTWIQNTKVRTAAESILNGLQKARSEALMRNAPVRFSLGANSAWTVGCVTAVADLNGDGLEDCPATIESRNSGEGNTATAVVNVTPGGATDAVFNNLGVRSALVANQINQVSVSFAGADRNLNVTLGAGGTVRLCDPSASDTDPRKC